MPMDERYIDSADICYYYFFLESKEMKYILLFRVEEDGVQF